MKRKPTFVFAALALLVFLSAPLQAQQPAASPSPAQPFTQEDKDKAKQELQKLGQAFGVQASPSPGATVSPGGKTMADVGDKALDMIGSAVAQISQQVEKVAPQFWRIMVKQQYAKALSMLITPWGLFLICIIYAKAMHRYWKFNKEEKVFSDKNEEFLTDRGVGGILRTFVPFLVGSVTAIWGVIAASNAIPMLINPEYYAVRDLLQMLLNPGSIGS